MLVRALFMHSNKFVTRVKKPELLDSEKIVTAQWQ